MLNKATPMFPVMVQLKGKKCVVIGGGEVACRKTLALLDFGATVAVVSPEVCDELLELGNRSLVEIILKEADPADFQDSFLIIAATNSTEVNQLIVANAKPHQLVNVASGHQAGNIHIPAYLKRGRLVISVSTGGASPTLTRKIRNDLSEKYNDSYVEYTEYLYQTRLAILQSCLSQPRKLELLKGIASEEYKNQLNKRKALKDWLAENEGSAN